MISHEECQYYLWLGQRFSGRGEVVELGSWLGRSTFFIVMGLRRSGCFQGRRLHLFDDFVWRTAWMDRHYPAEPPTNHASFRSLFERNVAAFRGDLAVTECKISDYEGNEALPPLSWESGPIELVYVDCGRTLDVNEAWFTKLVPAFVPGETVVVLQDWQTYKETPARSYNETKVFTDGKAGALELLHELRAGSVGTFLYRG